MKKLLIIFVGIACFSGCYYDIEEELYPTLECNTTDMSYTQDILPILQNNCYQCHDQANNLGNVTLEGYDNLIIRVNSGRLLGAIKRESGFSPMPKDQPQLLDCQIAKIEQWVNSGAPDN